MTTSNTPPIFSRLWGITGNGEGFPLLTNFSLLRLKTNNEEESGTCLVSTYHKIKTVRLLSLDSERNICLQIPTNLIIVLYQESKFMDIK